MTYADILALATNASQKQALDFLLDHIGQAFNKAQLVRAIFDVELTDSQANDNNNSHVRALREIIEALRLTSLPIISTPDSRGYRLTDNPDDLQPYILAQEARYKSLRATIDAAYHAKDTALQIHELARQRQNIIVGKETPKQASMFGNRSNYDE